MQIIDTVLEKVSGALGYLILKELRRIATALECSVDLERSGRGLQPIFAPPAEGGTPPEPSAILSEIREAGGDGDQPDWLTTSIIEALAEEYHVPVVDASRLMQLAREQGWIDREGQIVMLPKALK